MSMRRVEHDSHPPGKSRWAGVSSFIDALFEPDRHCACGHHEGSHNHGFTGRACMWCECTGFVDEAVNADAKRPLRRSLATS